jgi:hypothetical protein
MMAKRSVLVIGLEPTLVDYADFPGLDASKVLAALKADRERLNGLGYDAQLCLIDLGETAEAVVLDQLRQKWFDCIVIGAGVRTVPSHFILFERLINVGMNTPLKPSYASTRNQVTRLRQYSVGSEMSEGHIPSQGQAA